MRWKIHIIALTSFSTNGELKAMMIYKIQEYKKSAGKTNIVYNSAIVKVEKTVSNAKAIINKIVPGSKIVETDETAF